MQNAALSGREKSLASASVQGGLGFSDVAERMRRLSGPCGGAARQNALAAADAASVSYKDNGARAAHTEAMRLGDMRREV